MKSTFSSIVKPEPVSHTYKAYAQEVSAAIASVSQVIPAQRTLHRSGFSFSGAPFHEQLHIWKHIWNTASGWRPRIHAFFFLEKHLKRADLIHDIWQTSCSWQNDVCDWGLCDALAKLNTKALEVFPDEVYRQLCEWNTSADLFKRRQSVVSLLYFSRTKKVFLPFEQLTALMPSLLPDKEYYVQKGLGWALRELHTVYPETGSAYIRSIVRGLQPIAFTIAIEKMSVAEKDNLKTIRRK